MSKRLLNLYQLLAGLCDTSTGLLLIFGPAWTLRLMGISAPPIPLAFASFVGAFVLSVGLSYLLVLGRAPLSGLRFASSAAAWQSQWQLTAVVRTAVALVLVANITFGKMEVRWITVAVTDALLAGIQWFGLFRGWFNDAG